MNINWSHAVQIFKFYGGIWYQGAQKFPIEVYKDMILLYEFIHMISSLAASHDSNKLGLIKGVIIDREQAYHLHNHEDEVYGALIEMMDRRKIAHSDMKSFFQSMLLDASSIRYHDSDELKVYITGVAESVATMVCQIIGCAPPGHSHAKSIAEGVWLIHMIYTLGYDTSVGYCYIPQTTLDTHRLSSIDIHRMYQQRYANESLRSMIREYIDRYDELCEYGIQGLGYSNPNVRVGILYILEEHQKLVEAIQRYEYNIFHPHFSNSIQEYIRSRGTYLRYSIQGNK